MARQSHHHSFLNCASPVQVIHGVWRFVRPSGFYRSTHAPLGHLIHYVDSGNGDIQVNGRDYHVTAGDLVYYNGPELVNTDNIAGDEALVIYSINFSAPALPPLHLGNRVLRHMDHVKGYFQEAYRLSGEPDCTMSISIELHQQLLSILTLLYRSQPESVEMLELENNGWWLVENWIRQTQSYHTSIDHCCQVARCSEATLRRLSRKAVGMSPVARIRELRMEAVCALLQQSSLPIAAIASQLGYSRPNELSREFKVMKGVSPREFRAK